jgi:DNA-binding response OmpR family regulator
MADACKKILCIEDDRESAKLIAEELSARGFDVVIAYDGRVGLFAILRKIPDIVLCGVGLPGLSGFDVLASMNTALPLCKRVPFVLVTGSRNRRDELRGRNLGADDYVAKPIDFDILEAIIRARLTKGVVRREVPATRPSPLPRVRQHRGSSDDASWGQIVELTDAPTVEFDPDYLGPTADEIDRS